MRVFLLHELLRVIARCTPLALAICNNSPFWGAATYESPSKKAAITLQQHPPLLQPLFWSYCSLLQKLLQAMNERK
jgi:hypothetical protein